MKNYYTKFIAFCTSIALVSPVISLQTIHAADAPTLKIATVSIDGEQIIPESQQNPDEQAADSSGSAATEIQVDLSVTNNSGFLVSSFGISYDLQRGKYCKQGSGKLSGRQQSARTSSLVYVRRRFSKGKRQRPCGRCPDEFNIYRFRTGTRRKFTN